MAIVKNCEVLNPFPREVFLMKAGRFAVNAVIIFVLLSFALSGCGGGGGGSDQISPSNKADSSGLSRNPVPQAAASVTQSVVNASNALGIALLKQVSTNNAVVAPFRASLSLARLRAGAAGETKNGISQVMNLDAAADVDDAFNSLDLAVGDRIASASLGGQTSQASSRGWVQKRYGYLLTYLDNMAQNYGLQMAGVDYALAQSDAWTTISNWSSTASGGFSGTLNLSQDTRLVLGDALRLNAAWESPFDAAQTKTDWFQLLDGNYEEVTFMRRQGAISTTSVDGYAAYELPAGGNGLTFLIIVPEKDRYNEVVSSLTATKLTQIVTALTPAVIDLMLPKFTIAGSTVDLSVGNGAQKDVADFSALDGTKDLYVMSKAHNAKFAVNESGLQGSSVTLLGLDDAHPETWTNPGSDGSYGVIIYNGSIDYTIPVAQVAIGRPFIFLVRDSFSGVVLFIGRVLNPAE